MSYADERFIQNCRDILTNGVWDTELEVRPHWEDGTPAHTVKKFGIINRYDLREEFPILTLRRTYFKTCIDELLWIWQQKSNNIHDLRGHIWDSWADGTGSIGKAYGYQLAVKHQYPEGEFDQVDRVLYDLKHNPASRRIMTNIYNFQDLHEMALYPCAYSMTFNVSGHTLNAILNQRSQDMLAANNWNVVQYAVLVHMMAQVSGLEAGVHQRGGPERAGADAGEGAPSCAQVCYGPLRHGFLPLYTGQLLAGGLRAPPLRGQDPRGHLRRQPWMPS